METWSSSVESPDREGESRCRWSSRRGSGHTTLASPPVGFSSTYFPSETNSRGRVTVCIPKGGDGRDRMVRAVSTSKLSVRQSESRNHEVAVSLVGGVGGRYDLVVALVA